MKKYLADSKMFELDRFQKECQKSNQPFVKARKNPVDNNYLVQLDLITCNYRLTLETQNRIREFFQDETSQLDKNGFSKSIVKGSNVNSEHAWYDGVLSDRLDKFCLTLFDLASKEKF